MDKKGNALVLILAAIALLSLATAGYFFWQNQQFQQNNSTYTSPVTNNSPKSPTPVPVTRDETANWKIYTNSQYGFSFRYSPYFT